MPGSSPGMTYVAHRAVGATLIGVEVRVASMPLPSPILLALPLLLIAAAAAHPQSGPPGFQSPKKTIACQFFTDDKANVLRCDIAEMATKPRRPADCDLEWGDAFEMNSKGVAARICHGDTAMDKTLPVLAYGEVWQRGGFTCKPEQTGLTCFNADRHGFMISRARQDIF